MQISEYERFPTHLLTILHPDVDDLNRELVELFARAEFQDDFAMHPDALNLLDMAERCPCIARLRAMFQDGLRRWLFAQQVHGDVSADAVLFTNLAGKGEFTMIHNHSADVVGVYYIRTGDHARPMVIRPGVDGEDDYFAAEDGALILHDPRFNANLAAVRTRDYAKVFPRPGLMLLFPGYLWHSVTPHQGEFRRLAISANFNLRWGSAAKAEPWALRVEKP